LRRPRPYKRNSSLTSSGSGKKPVVSIRPDERASLELSVEQSAARRRDFPPPIRHDSFHAALQALIALPLIQHPQSFLVPSHLRSFQGLLIALQRDASSLGLFHCPSHGFEFLGFQTFSSLYRFGIHFHEETRKIERTPKRHHVRPRPLLTAPDFFPPVHAS